MRPSRLILASMLLTSTVLGAPPLSVIHDDPDRSGNAGRLTFLDPETTTPIGSAALGVRPIASVFDAETGRLFVVNQGKWDVMSQRPSGASMSLTVIDAATRAAIAERPLPASPNAVVAAPGEGRLFVTSAGHGDTQSVVTVIDRRTLEQVASVPLGPSLNVILRPERQVALLSPSGGTVFVLRSPSPLFDAVEKTSRNASARLAIFDAVTGNLREQRELAPHFSQVLPSRDGKVLYVLCLGHDSRGTAKETGAFGKLYVLDSETGAELATLDAGFLQAWLDVEEETGRLALIVRSPATGNPYVALLDGPRIVAKLDVGNPIQVAAIPGSTEQLVLADQELLRVDATSGTILGRRTLPAAAEALIVSPDGSNAWISPKKGSHFYAVPLPTMEVVRDFTSGRAGVKFGKGLAAATLFMVSLAGAVAGGAVGSGGGGSPAFYYTPRASNPSIVFSPDGAYLFVYNRQTEDVTILETATMSILDMAGVGDGVTTLLFPIAHKRGVLAVWDGGSAVVEVGADKKTIKHSLAGVGGSFSGYWDSPAARTGAATIITVRTMSAALSKKSITLVIRDDRLWIPRKKGFDVVSLVTGTMDKKVPLANPWGVSFP